MNSFQLRQFRKKYHHWSNTIKSFDFRMTPTELRKSLNVSDEDFRTFFKLPYCRDDAGGILVNESFAEWKLTRDLLLSLDRLPESLLLDIYKMESKRYTEDCLDNLSGCSDDEAMRRVLYKLLPEIMWARGFQDRDN